MDKISMDYFNQLQFVTWGNNQDSHDIQSNRFFDGYYGIQCTMHGQVEYAIGTSDSKRIADAPCVIVTRPGLRFDYATPNGSRRHHAFVCFRGERAERYVQSGLLPWMEPGDEPLQLRYPQRFSEKLFALLRLLGEIGGTRSPWAVHLLEGVLLELQEAPEKPISVRDDLREKLEQLQKSICETPQRTRIWEEEAAKLAISQAHFRRIFKQVAGCGPLQFQIEAQLALGAKLLCESSLSIQQVAMECGFGDEFYFSRLFKKHRGLPPSTYRQDFGQKSYRA